jgi:asparagine synthase (glutamine-hydrolysing)
MGVSLEGRVPMLDPAVAGFACSLPRPLKLRGRKGKWALRKVLARYVPTKLFERPKMGFGVPVGAWLRGPAPSMGRGGARRSLLEEGRVSRRGGDPADVAAASRWRRNLDAELWAVLMFQAWYMEWEGQGALVRR